MADIEFEKIAPTEAQIVALYDLLLKRKHTISHKAVPSFEDHAAFVNVHPYRAWYLVLVGDQAIGTFYISNENTVGINITDSSDEALIDNICSHIIAEYAPLPEIKSVRGPAFAINVAPDNEFLINALERLNKKVLQISYSLE